MQPTRPRRLSDYYLIEAISAASCTLFVYCSFFWARERYGYSDTDNLLLGAAQGLIYIAAARYGGRLADRMGYDRLIARCLSIVSVVLLLGWIPSWRGMPFVVSGLYLAFISPTWPAIEATLMHTPGTLTMPQRLGGYNITWAFSAAVGFFVSGFLFAWKPDSILWAPGLVHALQWLWFRRTVGALGAADKKKAMDIPHRGHDVPQAVKRRFLRLAWLANGMAYLMVSGFTALTPHLGERLSLPPTTTIWLACTLLLTRGISFVIFWQWQGWHYRMPWSLAAMWTAPLFLFIVFFSGRVLLVFLALAAFGMTLGLTYYTSIYYSLDYGENKGELGGLHEAIIGIGGLIGPLAGVLGAVLLGGTAGAQAALIAATVIIGAIGMLIVLGAAKEPWKRAVRP